MRNPYDMEKKQKKFVTVISYYGTMEKHLKTRKTALMFPQITSTAMPANSRGLIKDKALCARPALLFRTSGDCRCQVEAEWGKRAKIRSWHKGHVSGVQQFFSSFWSDSKNRTLNQDLQPVSIRVCVHRQCQDKSEK